MQGWLTQWGTPMMPMRARPRWVDDAQRMMPGMPGKAGEMPMMSGMGMMSAADMEAGRTPTALRRASCSPNDHHHLGRSRWRRTRSADGQFDAIALSKPIISVSRRSTP